MSAPKDKRGRDGILPGLLKGMATTAKSVMRPTHTAEYPHAEPTLPPRSRGVIALLDRRFLDRPYVDRLPADWLAGGEAAALGGDLVAAARDFFAEPARRR